MISKKCSKFYNSGHLDYYFPNFYPGETMNNNADLRETLHEYYYFKNLHINHDM